MQMFVFSSVATSVDIGSIRGTINTVVRKMSVYIYRYLLNGEDIEKTGKYEAQIGLSDRPQRVYIYIYTFKRAEASRTALSALHTCQSFQCPHRLEDKRD